MHQFELQRVSNAAQARVGTHLVQSSAEVHRLNLVHAIAAATRTSETCTDAGRTRFSVQNCLQMSKNSLELIFERPSASSALRTRILPWLLSTSLASDKDGSVELTAELKVLR